MLTSDTISYLLELVENIFQIMALLGEYNSGMPDSPAVFKTWYRNLVGLIGTYADFSTDLTGL